jgi:hypothetical protein
MRQVHYTENIKAGGHKMAKTIEYLESLIEETHKPEAEIMAQAFRTGVRQMWRERVLGRYLIGEITREKAIELTGVDWVDLAENSEEPSQIPAH